MTTTCIDVTVPLEAGGFPVFEGDPPFRRTLAASIAGGDVCNTSSLECSVHSGTHVDAPLHFIEGGGGVETLSLDAMIGSAWVADARDATDRLDSTGHRSAARHLDAAAIDALDIPAGTERLLLLTSNSQLWESPEFNPDFVALTADAVLMITFTWRACAWPGLYAGPSAGRPSLRDQLPAWGGATVPGRRGPGRRGQSPVDVAVRPELTEACRRAPSSTAQAPRISS